MVSRPNSSIKLDESDFAQLALCIDSIGTAEFPERLSNFFAQLCKADSVFLSAFFDHEKPAAIYTDHNDEAVRAALEVYTEVAYVLDPFFLRFREKKGDEVLRLREIAPDTFRKSEYYHQFYKRMGLRDECGLLIHISDNAALFFSFGAHEKGRITSPARLAVATAFVAALARRHWTALTPSRPDGTGRLAAHLEAAFDAFGTSVLSPRESEITQMILRGHSSKSIARVFGNSPETIKVHRRRIFSKLGIASQGELLSLFLSALAVTPVASIDDPLMYFYAK